MACVLVALLPCFAAAQTLRVAAERASIRTEPSADASILTTVERGTELDLLGTSGNWYRVRVRATGVEGWINNLLVDRKVASPPPAPPTAPSAIAVGAEGTWDRPRGYLSLTLAYFQPASKTFPNVGRTVLFAETATFDFPVSLHGGRLFELGGTVAAGRFGFGATFGRVGEERPAELRLTLPHPYFFREAQTATAFSDPLKRSESALHLQFAWMPLVSDTHSVALFGGPSFVSVKQDLVSSVDWVYVFVSPFTPSFYEFWITKIQVEEVSSAAWGYNIGGDVAYFIVRNVGVGMTIRFSRATVALKNAIQSRLDGRTVTADLKVGGFQIGFGARVRL